MGNVGGLLRKNIRTAKTPQGTKFSSVPVEAISLGDRKLAFRLVSIYIYTHFLILTYSQLHPNGEEACPVSEEDQDAAVDISQLSESEERADDMQHSQSLQSEQIQALPQSQQIQAPHQSQQIQAPPQSQQIQAPHQSQQIQTPPQSQLIQVPSHPEPATQSQQVPQQFHAPQRHQIQVPSQPEPTTQGQQIQGLSQSQQVPQQIQVPPQPEPTTQSQQIHGPSQNQLDGSDDEFELAVQEFGLPTELEELTEADLDSCMTFDNTASLSAANVFITASISQPVPDAVRESVPQTPHTQPELGAPILVWVKLKGFPLWPARVSKTSETSVELVMFDNKKSELTVQSEDTKPFCRREDLDKKISIPAKYKADWSKGYDACLNIFIELCG